jgi:acyl carrier protein phosphodiesterase
VALPGQVEALARELRDHAEVIHFLARGWTPVEPGVSLTDLIEATVDIAERLRELGGRLADVSSGHG